MRHLFTGLVAAVAVMAAAPALACGYNPCAAPVYVAPAPVAHYGCNPCGGGGWAHQRLAAPEQQYYYVNQGPTYTGPGNFAPARVYEEGSVSGYGYARPHHYGYRPNAAPRRVDAQRRPTACRGGNPSIPDLSPGRRDVCRRDSQRQGNHRIRHSD